MTRILERRPGDSGVVLRTLTAIFLTGGSLLAVLRDGAGVQPEVFTAGLALLWCGLGLEVLPLRGRLTRGRIDGLQLVVDLIAVGLVVAAAPNVPGLSVFFLGPVATAALRLGREGATAASTLAALGLLLPAMLRHGTPGSVSASTGLGAVLLLASGLAAGELVRLAARRRREEVRAVRRARRSSREVQMILDNLGSGLLTVDAEGRVTRINPLARTILGLGDRVCCHHGLDDVLGEERREMSDLVRGALEDGCPRRRAEVSVRRGSVTVPLGVNVAFLSGDDGALEGAVVIFTDLTEVRRLQEHLRHSDRLAGVGELAASIAHELRNPLASIRGSVELLASDLEVEGHNAQLMDLIQRESCRLNTLITDFLAFARMRPTHAQRLDLDPFLDQVLLQLRQNTTAHDGKVDISLETSRRGITVGADAEQLVQALLNLGINACEAMHYQGTLCLEVREDDGCCEIRVTDSGPGLDPDRAEDIFTPFVTTKPHGTGLGLPMVARIVHGHGGTIEAGNSPAGGAEFVMRLPLARQEHGVRDVSAPDIENVAVGVN